MSKKLDSLFDDPNFQSKLLRRIAEGWTFEKIEPMSTDEIFARPETRFGGIDAGAFDYP